jgi:hypothetical protein
MVWVYYRTSPVDFGTIDQVVTEYNPDLNMLADKYPDAIYFYAELSADDN